LFHSIRIWKTDFWDFKFFSIFQEISVSLYPQTRNSLLNIRN